MIRHISLAFAAVFLSVASVFAASGFLLQDNQTKHLYGPFQKIDKSRINLAGQSYEIRVYSRDRISFIDVDTQATYGPVATVDGRLVRIGNGMYAYYAAGSKSLQGTRGQVMPVPRVKPALEASAPPPMPKRIDIPEEEKAPALPARDLPALPETKSSLAVDGWFAFLDNTPIDWKVSSMKGADSDIERISLGGDVFWNGFSAGIGLSPSVDGGTVVPEGVGVTSSSFEGDNGFMLEVGYHRPFLSEGGWEANAGLRGQIRQDKGSLSSTSLVSTGEVDTNNVGNVIVDYQTQSSSLKVTELSLWIDIGLSYTYDKMWCGYANFAIEPVSEYDVSGSFWYGGHKLSVEADRSTPIAFTLGGWCNLGEVFERVQPVRVFADITFGADLRFRAGAGWEF